MAADALAKGGAVDVVAGQLKAAGEAAEGGGAEALTVAEAADYAANDPPPLDPIIEGICECGDKGEEDGHPGRDMDGFGEVLAFHREIFRVWE